MGARGELAEPSGRLIAERRLCSKRSCRDMIADGVSTGATRPEGR